LFHAHLFRTAPERLMQFVELDKSTHNTA
jgi:hypothetical protein